MGKRKNPCWEYVNSITDPANPNKKRWQCNYCSKDYAGGASRIKVHLGLEKGQGIEVCQKVKEGTIFPEREKEGLMSHGLENGRSSSTENAQIADNPSPGGIQGTLRCIEAEMDRPVYTPDPSMLEYLTTLEANLNHSAAVMDSQPHVDPSNILLQQCNNQNMPSPSSPANPQQAMEQQNMSASTTICEQVVDITGRDHGVQSGLLPFNPYLQEECHQADAMQVEQDLPSERDQSIGAAFPQFSTELPRNTGDSGGDAILVTELAGQEFKSIVDQIWNYVTKDDILRIGMYGMGGVGKTTIVKHLYNKVLASAAFDDVFWITVSKDCSIHELQNKIAKALKVPYHFKEVDEVMRPTLLFNHFRNRKKTLIILDDLWQHFELQEFGIPVMKDGIQLVLTTRNRRVCEKMLCQKTIGIKPLSDEESWMLFVQTLCSDLSPSLEPIAKSIVEQCKGLPLAILVMARSMRGVDSDHGWEDALEKQKQPEALQEDMQTFVFPILQHSYDHLDAKKQQCLLQCALYPKDWKIPRGKLIELCIDVGVIHGDSRWKMYNEGHQLLDELEKACLLELDTDRCSNKKMVSMHDVIRDMALYIMNANSTCMVKSGLYLDDVPHEDEWTPNLQKVSLIHNDKIEVFPSITPSCPQLSTLLLSECWMLCEIPECFFERLPGLKVIDLSYTRITKVPESLTKLEKLNAVLLRECFKLSLIPCLAKLTALRKLDLRGCWRMKRVPDGLGMLVNLTYLDLTDTSIERIPEGVIGRLLKLQYLATGCIEVKGEEIAKLTKLESLYCRFQNVNELSEYVQHATMIRSYLLITGSPGFGQDWRWISRYSDAEFLYPDLTGGKKYIVLVRQYSEGETIHVPRVGRTLTVERYNGTWIINIREVSSALSGCWNSQIDSWRNILCQHHQLP